MRAVARQSEPGRAAILQVTRPPPVLLGPHSHPPPTPALPDRPPSPSVPAAPTENKEKIKLNNQLPYLVANIVEALDVAPEEEEEEDGATVDLDAQRKGEAMAAAAAARAAECAAVARRGSAAAATNDRARRRPWSISRAAARPALQSGRGLARLMPACSAQLRAGKHREWRGRRHCLRRRSLPPANPLARGPPNAALRPQGSAWC
jgi:hypothetical protein